MCTLLHSVARISIQMLIYKVFLVQGHDERRVALGLGALTYCSIIHKGS